jgi:YgiT-type zinc finger domain-containing protein
MMCDFCKTGILHEGTTTVTLERNNTIIVFKGVPAFVCNQCGEAYTSEEVTENLLDIAEKEMDKGKRQKEEFLQYAAPDAEEKIAL